MLKNLCAIIKRKYFILCDGIRLPATPERSVYGLGRYGPNN